MTGTVLQRARSAGLPVAADNSLWVYVSMTDAADRLTAWTFVSSNN